MWMRRLSQNLREVWIEAVALCGLRYPAFVYGGGLSRDEIPVFCLHGVDAESFTPELAHLAENGYVTLSADELYDAVTGGPPAPKRSVMLTFDDGDQSVWTIGVPLLARYGMRATLFVIPGRTPGDSLTRPTLDDVWSGRITNTAFAQALAGTPTLMTWPEIIAAQASGILDLQSHSMTHALVFTSPQVMEFVNPSVRSVHPFELPLFRTAEGADALDTAPPLGTPLYRSAPGLSTRVRYLESAAVRQACVDYVAEHGGETFFARPQWREALQHVETEARSRWDGAPRYETPAERRAALLRELATSKRAIEERLPGHTVRHFCYPWGYGLPELADVAKEAGYVTSFWLDAHRCWSRVLRVGHDAHRIPRLGEGWIMSLPGTGRSSFASRMVEKVKRRFTEGSPYLTHA